MELVYTPSDAAERDAVVRLRAWADASYGTHSDMKSHLGHCQAIGEHHPGKFQASSRKDSVVALSACESECDSAVESTKAIVVSQALLRDFGHPAALPTPLMEDNESLIGLCSAPLGQGHKRTKHFATRIAYLLDNTHRELI